VYPLIRRIGDYPKKWISPGAEGFGTSLTESVIGVGHLVESGILVALRTRASLRLMLAF
jgi:hypothetical protein